MLSPHEGVKMRTRRNAGGRRNQPGRAWAGAAHPLHDRSLPTWTQMSVALMNAFILSLKRLYLQTIYRSVFAYSSIFLYGIILDIVSPVVLSPTQPRFMDLILINTCCSRSFIIRCYLEFLWVNMPHLSHVPAEGHIGYSPFSAIMNDTGMSILTWASSGEVSRQ